MPKETEVHEESDTERNEQVNCSTDTEQSDNDIEASDGNNNNNNDYLIGKDNVTKWEFNPPSQWVRTDKANIVIHLPGVKGSAKNVDNIVDAWKLFFPLSTVEEIVTCTKIYLEKLRVKGSYQATDAHNTNLNEIHALIGVLFLIGLKHGSHLNLRVMVY